MPDLSTEIGTAAWRIEDPDTQDGISGMVQTSGVEGEVGSYRSELQGVHTMLLGLWVFCQFHGILEGRVRLGCDNEVSVHHIQGDWTKVSLSLAHADIIRVIRVIKAQIPVKVDFEHVYGHQDNFLSIHELPRMVQINIQMDHNAKQYLFRLLTQSSPVARPSAVTGEGWQCWVQGEKLTSDPGTKIRMAVFGSWMKSHLVSKYILTVEAFNDIDWRAMEGATSSFPPLYKLWIAKHVSGFCGLGKMQFHWGYMESSKCPCCSHPCEDKEHLLTCPDVDCTSVWQDFIESLEV